MSEPDHDAELIEQLGKSATLYTVALNQARQESFDSARETFESLLLFSPQLDKAWISYAQVIGRFRMRVFNGC